MSNANRVRVFQRGECIVIVCRDSGERHVYRRKTKLHPIVFDGDAYCWALILAREWLYGIKLISKLVTLTVAPSGFGKSSKSVVEAVAMATGLDLLGIGWKPEKPLRSVVLVRRRSAR